MSGDDEQLVKKKKFTFKRPVRPLKKDAGTSTATTATNTSTVSAPAPTSNTHTSNTSTPKAKVVNTDVTSSHSKARVGNVDGGIEARETKVKEEKAYKVGLGEAGRTKTARGSVEPVDGGGHGAGDDNGTGGGGEKLKGRKTRRGGNNDKDVEAMFFTRSENVYTAIIEEEKQKKAKKQKEREKKKQRSSQAETLVEEEYVGVPGGRKRKSEDREDSETETGIIVPGGIHGAGAGETSKRPKKRDAGNVISLDSSDDNGGGDSDDGDDSDSLGIYDGLDDNKEEDDDVDEILGLKRRGRGRKKQKKDVQIIKPPRKRSLTPPPQIYIPRVTPVAPISISTSISTSAPLPLSITPNPAYSTYNPSTIPPQSQNRHTAAGGWGAGTGGTGPTTICLDSDDDSNPSASLSKPTINNIITATTTNAPTLPELEARARAIASPTPPATQPMPATATSQNSSLPSSTNLDPTHSTTVLITSPLPNTRPLLAKIRYNQKLRVVRLAWCRYQQPPGAIDEKEIFLTYNGRKVFDANTFMGIGADAGGRRGRDVTGVDVDWGDEEDEDEGGSGRSEKQGVIFVAVDEEAFRQMQREGGVGSLSGNSSNNTGNSGGRINPPRADNENESLNPTTSTLHPHPDIEILQNDEDDDEDNDDEDATTTSSLKLTFRGKSMDKLRLKVKPTTKISSIISILLSTRSSSLNGRDVKLKFDGDVVSPLGKVGDVDWEDGDVVEVWVK